MLTDHLIITDVLNKIERKQISAKEGFELIKSIKRGNPEVAHNLKPALYFNSLWQKAAAVSSSQTSGFSGTILLFDNSPDLWEALKRISGSMLRAVLVEPGSGFKNLGEDRYSINVASYEDYSRLFTELHKSERMPYRILHLLSHGDFDSDYRSLNLQLESGLYSLYMMVKALMGCNLRNCLEILYVYPTGGKVQPQFAAVSAFARTLCLENARFMCKTVGMESLMPSAAIEVLYNEFESGADSGVEVIYRNGERYVRKLVEYNAKGRYTTPIIREKGVYLVTGGAGSIGLAFTKHLLMKYKAKVILTGRSFMSLEKEKTVGDLKAYGGEVVYLKADVGEKNEAENAIKNAKEMFGEINGIIHCAGINIDRLIQNKNLNEIREVIKSKVMGTVILDEASVNENLDFFVLFSSTAAVLGNRGQGDYAFANCFMDYFADIREEWRREGKRNGKTLSINWPIWDNTNMGVDKQTLRLMSSVAGVKPMTIEKGIDVLTTGLSSPNSRIMAMDGEVEKLRRFLDKEILHDMFYDQTEMRHTGVKCSKGSIDNTQVMTGIREQLAKFVYEILKIDLKRINFNDDMQEYGFDSVTQTKLINDINEMYGLDFSPTVFYELQEPTLECLAQYLFNKRKDVFSAYQLAETNESGAVAEAEEVYESAVIPEASFEAGENISRNEEWSGDELTAIIGMSCVMPGSKDAETFWDNIESGKDLISEIPGDRRDNGAFTDLDSKIRCGGFIEGIDKFDAKFFGLSPREAEYMDPQQRIFLQIVWKAIEDAGYKASELSGTSTGVFAGTASLDYFELWKEYAHETDAYSSTGMAPSILANRISYLLNLHGPSQTIDTACSSSLVAVSAAVDSITTGRCEMAIAGGVNILLSATAYNSLSVAGMLSPEGRCKTFDESADGYIRGEGCGALVIKSLKRAIEDGDHIYAVIRGVAVNHGGRANSLTAPNANAQAELLQEAYMRAGVDPSCVSYIEAHGTGTKLGDPIEINGLKMAFEELYKISGKPIPAKPHCGIGAVKANIGHLEAASGIAGLIKTLLAMKHRKLPGIAHFKNLNPHIKLSDSPFYIVEKTMPWERLCSEDGSQIPRIAGVSSFGFGGTNVHVVLEEYDKCREYIHERYDAQVILLSARDETRLKEYAGELRNYLEKHCLCSSGECISLDKLAFSLQFGRESMEERLAIVVRDIPELEDKLGQYQNGSYDIEGCYTGSTSRYEAHRDEYPAGKALKETDLKTLARLWASGADIDWYGLYTKPYPGRIPLPTYPFEKKSFWFNSYKNGSLKETDKDKSSMRLNMKTGKDTLDVSTEHQTYSEPLGNKKLILKKCDGMDKAAESVSDTVKITGTEGKRGRIKDILLNYLAQILHISRDDIEENVPMREFGLDSIGSVELINALNKEFGSDYKSVVLYDYYTVEMLSEYLACSCETDFACLKDNKAAGGVEENQPATGPEERSFGGNGNGQSVQEEPNAKEYIRYRLLEYLAEILHVDRSDIGNDTPMREFGLDSIGTVELVNALNKEFGADLKAVVIYDYHTVEKLADYLAANIKASLKPTVDFYTSTGKEGQEFLQLHTVQKKADHESSGAKCGGERIDICRDVAVIGMSGKFPGASNISEFWDVLSNGKDCITEVPKSRWDIDEYYHPDPLKPGKTYSKWGGFINDVDKFDPLFFRISPSEAEVIDPQQRLFLEECYKALEMAGYSDKRLNGLKCGVYVGIVNINDYGSMLNDLLYSENLGHAMLGNANSILASRISYFLNLKGPAISVDTACSSSHVAVHMAYKALQHEEAEMALAGGVMLQLSQKRYILTSKSGALSHVGRCNTFDNSADGYVPGEGVGVIVLKRLDKAIKDRDFIYGVIKGSVLNQDGTTNGITAPCAESQRDLELEVYNKYNINPETITFVEAHGTGTKLGDPIELSALTQSFRQFTNKKQYCAIGSVKTNIGHGASAAGIASVIKALLSLKNRKIPPSLNYKSPNEHFNFEDCPFYVNTVLKDWESEGGSPLRAAISGFGLSGTNCHMVIEEPPIIERKENEVIPQYHIIVISAKTQEALERKLCDLEKQLEEDNILNIGDISYTLAVGRSSFEVRLAIVASDVGELLGKLKELKKNGMLQENCFYGIKKKSSGKAPVIKEEADKLVEELGSTDCIQGGSYKSKLLRLAELYSKGYDPDLAVIFKNREVYTVALPVYPFDEQQYWINFKPFVNKNMEKPDINMSINDSIKYNLTVADRHSNPSGRVFKLTVTGSEFYLTDHVIDGQKVFPAVACAEMARAAGELFTGEEVSRLKNIILAQPLVVKDTHTDIYLDLNISGDRLEFRISTMDLKGCKTDHSQGYIVNGNSNLPDSDNRYVDIQAVKARCSEHMQKSEVYDIYRQVGVEYGPCFQSIREICYNRNEALSVININEKLIPGMKGFVLHPTLMDALLQTTLGVALGNPDIQKSNYLPFVIGEVDIYENAGKACYSYAVKMDSGQKSGGQIMKFDIKLLDESGKVLIIFKEFSARATGHKLNEGKKPEGLTASGYRRKLNYYYSDYQKASHKSSENNAAEIKSVLLFDTDFGFALELEKRGVDRSKVVLVRPGNTFEDKGSMVYRINPSEVEDYMKLFDCLKSKGIVPSHIIHKWSCLEFGSGAECFEKKLEHGIYSVFHTVKVLTALKLKDSIRLLYVYPDSEEQPQPQYKAVSAFAKSVCKESSKILIKTVEIFQKTIRQAMSLVNELTDKVLDEFEEDCDSEVRYEDSKRYTACIKEFDPEPGAESACAYESAFRRNGVYIITGGIGGLGLIFAKYLIAEYDAALVLVGRSTPGADKLKVIDEMISQGGEVIYLQADISRREGVDKVKNIAKSRYGKINGIIHGAGMINDAYIHHKSLEDMKEVIAPKVYGIVNLDEALRNEKLDLFVAFSAIASMLGNAGQSDYAYANCFMDRYIYGMAKANERENHYGKVLSVNWPLWKDGGMKLDERLEHMLKISGMRQLNSEDGIKTLEMALVSGKHQLLVVDAETPGKEKTNEIREGNLIEDEQNAPRQTDADSMDIFRKVQRGIREVIGRQLKMHVDAVEGDRDLKEYGLDSINLTVLANLINEKYSLDMTPAVFFELEELTIDRFAEYLLENYYGSFAETSEAAGMDEKKNMEMKPDKVSTQTVTGNTAEIMEYVRKDILEIIGSQLKINTSTLEPDKDLKEYGFDSINLTVLANLINEKYSLDMTPAVFFELEELTINELSEFLNVEYGDLMKSFYYNSIQKSINENNCTDTIQESTPDGGNEEYGSLAGDIPEETFGSCAGQSLNEPVAIIGVSGRMPQSCDLDEFWEHLEKGRSLVGEIPKERWDWREYYGDHIESGNKTNCKWAALMDNVDAFDARFFNISRREAELMDPQQRIIMETVWSLIEDAGYNAASLAKSKTGLFLGVSNSDYSMVLSESTSEIQAQAATGLSHAITGNRISYYFDFRGPCEVINTACSSSLVAVHNAVRAIRSGDCEMAIAGGVNAILSPLSQVAFGKVGVLSSDGKCRAFDKNANGIVRGEGAGAVLLKPLSRAVMDGDYIYGVIRSTGVNHGGHSTSLTAPNPGAQAELMADTYGKAGIKPYTISYIECHGTGTSLGDTVEINGLKKAFNSLYKQCDTVPERKNYCGIGSVKTNIGHLEAASGIASLIKVLLALKHKKIPANINFEALNPYIDLKDSPFYVVDKTKEWDSLPDQEGNEIPRRAGISSFGLGGTNAHVLIEEYDNKRQKASGGGAEKYIIVLSAKSKERLKEYAEKLIGYLSRKTNTDCGSLLNLSYTLQVGRQPMDERLAVVCKNPEELKEKLKCFGEGNFAIQGLYTGTPKDKADNLRFLFSGESGDKMVREIVHSGDYDKLARIWCSGNEIDWTLLYEGMRPKRIPLPTYPFSKDRYWLDGIGGYKEKSSKPAEAVIQKEPDNCFYKPVWVKEALAVGKAVETAIFKGTVLIIYAEDGQELAEALFEAYIDNPVVLAKLGSSTKQFPDGTWELAVNESGAFGTCIQTIKDLKCIYFLGGIFKSSQVLSDIKAFERANEKGVISLFRLMKELSTCGYSGKPVQLKVVTNNVYKVLPDEDIIPVSGALYGFTRAAAREYPAMDIGYFDIYLDEKQLLQGDSSQDTLYRMVQSVIKESGSKNVDIVALRGGERYVRKLELAQMPEVYEMPFKKNGVYIILGGAGGIGFELGLHLSQSVNARIVLLGRSNLDEEKKKRIAELEAAGGQAIYIQADTTDEQSINEAISTAIADFGQINGVIHSAVVLKDGTIEGMDEETLRKVLAPKVKGSAVLRNAFKDKNLDFMLFFSSAASFTGEAGRSAYTAASTFEDALAMYMAHSEPYTVKTVNWGYWGKVGVASSERYKESFKAKGVLSIEPDEGMQAVKRILSLTEPQVMMLKLEKVHKENRVETECSGEITGTRRNKPDPEAQTRRHQDINNENAVLEYIRGKITDCLCASLKTDPDEVEDTAAFGELGVDSVLAIEIVHKINGELGIQLRSTDLFNYSTLRQLIRYINNNFRIEMQDCHGDEESDDLELLELLVKLKQGEIDMEAVEQRIEAKEIM